MPSQNKKNQNLSDGTLQAIKRITERSKIEERTMPVPATFPSEETQLLGLLSKYAFRAAIAFIPILAILWGGASWLSSRSSKAEVVQIQKEYRSNHKETNQKLTELKVQLSKMRSETRLQMIHDMKIAVKEALTPLREKIDLNSRSIELLLYGDRKKDRK